MLKVSGFQRRLAIALVYAAVLVPSAPFAGQASGRPSASPSSLALFLLGHRIGEERTTITTTGNASELRSQFEYLDRGATVALDTTLTFGADFTPLSFESHGKSYRYFSVDTSVPKA